MEKPENLRNTSYGELLEHFSENDLQLFQVLEKVGPVEFELTPNPFQALVESILSQQVSTKSADSTIRKVLEFKGDYEHPEEWRGISREKWREFGVSRQKASYLDSLAEFFCENTSEIKALPEWSNDQIIDFLVQIKGIGEWTAHMFLMFSLGRGDVLAHGDLGIRSMSQRVYGLEELPEKAELLEISKNWEPHLTWAQIYLWRYSRIKD